MSSAHFWLVLGFILGLAVAKTAATVGMFGGW